MMDRCDAEKRLESMIDSYQDLIFSLAYRMLGDYFAAQDIAQECFISAYAHLSSIEEGREKAWLCVSARNRCIDLIRVQGRVIPAGDEELCGIAALKDTEQEVLERDVREELKRKCKRLKEPYAEVAYRYYVQEQGIEEIAYEMGEKPASVRTRLYRARDKLKQLYRKEVGQ